MERSAMWLWCLGVTAATTVAQNIVFVGGHSESSLCTTSSGERGRCRDIRYCEAALRNFRQDPPSNCGFNDSFPIVCCATPSVGNPEPNQDISPPSITFQCGRNGKDAFVFKEFADSEVLLPEASSPAGGVDDTNQRSPSRPPFTDLEANFSDFGGITEVYEAVGGVDAEKNTWPWMALIGELDAVGLNWFCGGVLINEQWVLSALHCFFDYTADVVRLGEHDYYDDGDGAAHQDFHVAEMVPYPGYTHPEAYHDLALLRLASKVTLQRFISPVCLPWGEDSTEFLTGQKTTLTGWGDTQFGGSRSRILQEVEVIVISSAGCDTSYSNLDHYHVTWPRGISEETLCAGDPDGGRDACQGDSGGPLVSADDSGRYVLAGIVSRGYGCGLKDYPGLYANMRHPPYLAWIKKVAFGAP